MAKTLIVIAGPTAIGKTTLAIKLANYYQTEIVSADSRQFYQEMAIGTAKPTPDELGAAKHHFIDSHSVTDTFSVGDYEKEAVLLIETLFKDHDQIILVGGSGLFVNAICNGFDDLPSASEQTRKDLNQLFTDQGIAILQEKLKSVDNPQRIIRALEVYETVGKPFSEFRKKSKKIRPFDIIKIGLNTSREKLYHNINTRVDQMVEAGLFEEVEHLRELRDLNALKTVGYTEVFDYFDGIYSKDEAIDKIKQNTRRFAKRQLTWFNKFEDIKWFEPNVTDDVISYLNSCLHYPAPAEQKS
jgi:tRNA dimethylallyltransferase